MPAHVPPAVTAPSSPSAAVQLDDAVLSLVVKTLCASVGREQFAMSPDVVSSDKKLSLHVSGSAAEVWHEGVAALRLAGVGTECEGAKGLCRFQVLPAPAPAAKPLAIVTYAPRFRTVGFLASALKSMFSGWSFDSGSAVPGMGGAAVSAPVSQAGPSSGASGGAGVEGAARSQDAVPGELVGVGPAELADRVRSVLPLLDRPVPAISVRVAVFEVDRNISDQSAIQFVVGVLNSASSVGFGVGLAGTQAGAITLKTPNFQAVISALSTSSLVHLVTAPVLRTSSGTIASFAVGDSVPTLGSVSYAQGSSTPVQSIQYQQSGVVFSVLPQVVGDSVDLALYQSISSFGATSVGVTSSPTLSNRAVASQLVLQPGQVVILGGLVQRQRSKGSEGLWFWRDMGRNSGAQETSIVLALQAVVGG